MVCTFVFGIGMIGYWASNLPMYAALLPRDRYGQFCSAQAMVNAVAMIIANYGAGRFIDLVHNYRFIYLWASVFAVLSTISMIVVYKGWRKNGGSQNYVVPV